MIITVTNNKGGVGKSTTVINLAHALSRNGYKVLVVDVDGQANTTITLCGGNNFEESVADLFVDNSVDVRSIIAPGTNVNVLPANSNLDAVVLQLMSNPLLGGQFRLKKMLEPIKDDYDFILIDTAPTMSIVTINALVAADKVIVPIMPGFHEYTGTARLFDAIREVQQNFAPHMVLLGVLFTMTDHTVFCRDIQTDVRQNLGDLVFDTIIPRNVKVKEALQGGEELYLYAPSSSGAEAYAKFSMEVLNRVQT